MPPEGIRRREVFHHLAPSPAELIAGAVGEGVGAVGSARNDTKREPEQHMLLRALHLRIDGHKIRQVGRVLLRQPVVTRAVVFDRCEEIGRKMKKAGEDPQRLAGRPRPRGHSGTDLPIIPRERTNDVIYFNPRSRERVLGINVLECHEDEQKPLVVSGLIATLRNIWPEAWGAPRTEFVLSNAAFALLDQAQPVTLVAVPKLLMEAEYRQKILRGVSNPAVLSFFGPISSRPISSRPRSARSGC